MTKQTINKSHTFDISSDLEIKIKWNIYKTQSLNPKKTTFSHNLHWYLFIEQTLNYIKLLNAACPIKQTKILKGVVKIDIS